MQHPTPDTIISAHFYPCLPPSVVRTVRITTYLFDGAQYPLVATAFGESLSGDISTTVVHITKPNLSTVSFRIHHRFSEDKPVNMAVQSISPVYLWKGEMVVIQMGKSKPFVNLRSENKVHERRAIRGLVHTLPSFPLHKSY